MQLQLTSTLKLNNGVEIPRLGLGVFLARRGGEARSAVATALKLGYRHIDTARIYRNEEDVGAALAASGVDRRQVFVTTKLWNDDHGYDSTLRACDASLKRLGLAQVDLYLVHWPVGGLRLETWRAMEALLADGKARAVGVSNYLERHLDELAANAKVLPAVDQVELHPFLGQKALVAKCHGMGIRVEAYSPLAKGLRMADKRLLALAKKVGRSPAQVMIRWALQRDLVVIPKSVREDRLRENAAVFDFELAQEEMSSLDALDENLHTGWDPTGQA